jgi:hypothetical protein
MPGELMVSLSYVAATVFGVIVSFLFWWPLLRYSWHYWMG